MKPKYIFSAVFAICVLMVTVLPQLAHTSPAAAASAKADPAAVAVKPAAVGKPAAAVAKAAEEKPKTQPTVLPTLAATPAAVLQPARSAPPASSLAESLPSPADLAAAAGQGLAAIPDTAGQPDLASFIASVSDGQASRLTGVYVQGQFAMPVVQQPAGDTNYVDASEHTITEYARSTSYNVTGLLAHDTVNSGLEFAKLKPGQDVILVYGNGRQARYRVERIENYQALSPTDAYSDFIDLNGPGAKLVRNEDLFRRIYTNAGQLVFQTCFEANGDPSWGRMFVIANPI